jgi:hypothetical protein
MRLATLLLTLAFALGALSPCAFDSRAAAERHAAPSGDAHAARRADAPPCHGAPVAAVKAPCRCGCDKRATGAISLGSLGVAILPPAAHAAPISKPAPRGDATLPALASAPARAIEKVPRVA